MIKCLLIGNASVEICNSAVDREKQLTPFRIRFLILGIHIKAEYSNITICRLLTHKKTVQPISTIQKNRPEVLKSIGTILTNQKVKQSRYDTRDSVQP